MDQYVCSECGRENAEDASWCEECGGFVECIERVDPQPKPSSSGDINDDVSFLFSGTPVLDIAGRLAFSEEDTRQRGTPLRVLGWGTAAVAVVPLVFLAIQLVEVVTGGDYYWEIYSQIILAVMAIPAVALACSIRLGLGRASTKDLVVIGIFWLIAIAVGALAWLIST